MTRPKGLLLGPSFLRRAVRVKYAPHGLMGPRGAGSGGVWLREVGEKEEAFLHLPLKF